MEKSAMLLLKFKSKILLQHRDNHPDVMYANHWGIPGGMIEKEETPLQALKREICEETGYRISKPKFIKIISVLIYGNKYVGYVYSENYNQDQQIHCYEGQEFAFKDLIEISKLIVIPHQLPIIKSFLQKDKPILSIS